MRLFISSLSQSTTSGGIANPFSREITVRPIVEGEHHAFPHIENVGGRLYTFYRTGTDHLTKNGIWEYQYSDDDGENWTTEIEYYNGEDIRDVNPDWFTNPDTKIDCRDTVSFTMSDGYVLLTGFVTVGLDGDAVGESNQVSVFMRVPVINGNTLDLANMTKSYHNDIVLGREVIEKDSILYGSAYLGDGEDAGVYRSLDFAVTWELVSIVWPIPPDTKNGNESAIKFIGDKLIFDTRYWGQPNTTPNLLAESTDLGVTWVSRGQRNIAHHGQTSFDLGGGLIAFCARLKSEVIQTLVQVWDWENGVEVSRLHVDGSEYPECSDRGYSKIVKKRDKYMMIYYNGIPHVPDDDGRGDTGIFFRQLNYNEETRSFEFGND